MTTLIRYSATIHQRNKLNMNKFCATAINPKHSPCPASVWNPPTDAPTHVPFLQRRITTPLSGRTAVLGSALHRHPHLTLNMSIGLYPNKDNI